MKNYLARLLCLVLLASIGCKSGNEVSNIVIKQDRYLPRPQWIPDYPIAFIGNWDAMPIFRRRVGGNPVWQEEDYKKEHTDAAVKKFRDLGVTMAVIHFYKGFGLKAEEEHIEEAKKLAALCKQNGLKVGTYIGSTVGYETMLLENPDAASWFVPDYQGQPVRYGNQTFRKRVYFMHPGYIEYIKKVVKIAITDLKTDLIQFDNTSIRAQPAIFHHPLAVQHFRDFLKKKYTPAMLTTRFGFSDVSYVEPPIGDAPMSVINDPLYQEWADFRCTQLANFYSIMAGYMHELNPEVAVCNNPHRGLSGRNTVWEQGVDYPRLLKHTDIVWTEEGNGATVTDDSILVSKIRTYKMARILNNRIFTYTNDSKLEMAEAMAYNRQGMGMIGGLDEMEGNRMTDLYGLEADQKNFVQFFRKHFDNYYRQVKSVSNVAVLHSYSSMAFNNDRPYQSTYLFEQTLIQEKIPFDIIFDDQLKDLSKYKVLILADQESLDSATLTLIRDFVRRGGSLVATEHTSLYTEWRQRRRDFGLQDLFGVNAPAWHNRSTPDDILKIPIQQKKVGDGKVVYIPEVIPAKPKPTTTPMTSQYWKLPVNRKELSQSVLWAADSTLPVVIEAPLSVTMELTVKEDNSASMLHLLNYDFKNTPAVQNIKVSIQRWPGRNITQVTVLTPDGRNDQVIPFQQTPQRVVFTVPLLTVYDLVVIK